jgi:hypothetical protein
MPAKQEIPFSPLVAQGLQLIAEYEAIQAERDLIAERLKAKDAELQAVNDQLIALGAGRYRDEENHTALVVAAVEPTLGPDTFHLQRDALPQARELAGENFRKLFDREEIYSPRDGFAGIAGALLTPARARDLLALCIVPGRLGGGRRAHVRWR